ncbi:uncharacterized protein LOC143038773 [Oratosquilla oratoria]|uniref:uncharacterized protein LOC143038773 n=1 Tax=Oratosquilla oratoria TaxID=337810 RepID=UPI003F77398F
MLLSALVLQAVVVLFCCACRCRVPRTKQEIEADHIRRKISRKFRKQLDIIKNSEMDTMDLMKALERLRQELKADTVSLAQSEAFSALSFTPTGTPTYRKGSDVNIGVSLEELNEVQATGPATLLRARVSTIITSALEKLKR